MTSWNSTSFAFITTWAWRRWRWWWWWWWWWCWQAAGLHWLAIPLGDVTFHQTLIAHPHLHQADLHHPHHHHADRDRVDEDDDQDPAPLSEKFGYGNFYEQHRSLFIRIKSLFIGISIQTKTPFKINYTWDFVCLFSHIPSQSLNCIMHYQAVNF